MHKTPILVENKWKYDCAKMEILTTGVKIHKKKIKNKKVNYSDERHKILQVKI